MQEEIPVHTFVDTRNRLFEVLPLNAKSEDDSANPHRHDYVALFLLNEEGMGNHEIDFIDYPIPRYSIHFVNRGQVHRLDRSPDRSSGDVILFNLEFVFSSSALSADKQLSILNGMNRFPVLELDAETYDLFRKIVQNMYDELAHPTRFTQHVLASYIYIIMARYQCLVEGDGGYPQERSSMAYRFTELVNEHLATMRQVQEYADKLHIGTKTLGRLCQEAFRKTPLEIIQDRLLVEVKRQAYYTEKSVKEIAADLSFNDSSHLNKFFKSQTGQTLGEFREQRRLVH